jgi:hypothetical protein
VRLRHPRITIGRAVGNTLTLPDPRISRRHCEIRLSQDPPRLVDLGSTHGVNVNGRSVRMTDLDDGDHIELGSFRLTFIAAPIDQSNGDASDAKFPCLEIECRTPGTRRADAEQVDSHDRVLGEALKQIEFLKRQLLAREQRSGFREDWMKSDDASEDAAEMRRRRENGDPSLDPPLPVELLFQVDGDAPRSIVDVDLGKWFVGLLLVLLAVALLWLFI